MPAESPSPPTFFLLHKVLADARQYWRERSSNGEKQRAIVQEIRELLLRLRQVPCAFVHDRLRRGLCSYDERLENIGCAHPVADDYEGPELLSAAGFALRELGVVTEEERVACAQICHDTRRDLVELDNSVLCSVPPSLPVLREGQCQAMVQKEGVRQAILQKIAAFLGENA